MPSSDVRDHLWIAVGDIHDEVECFSLIPELSQADGIIVTGDLTVTGGIKQAERVMDALCTHNLPVFAQIGNMDRPEVDTWLTEKDCNLHTFTRELTPDIAIFGVGGSTFTPFGTPSEFPESSVAAWLEACWHKARTYPHSVLISHNPPKGTACDVIPGNMHVGSSAVREFLEEAQPEICLCGHIHEARAVDRVGRTLVVNPGMLSQGGYVLLRAKQGQLTAELKILKN
ncbi:MAG: metallophosphoesterase family protein [Desulfovibrio sp.]|nr:metallophosphoesterase family protein [Desulfovibrio sp.]